MSYIIAFGADGCADVTRRYVRNQTEHAVPRNKCPEGVVVHIVQEINALRRKDMDKKQRFQLNAEDMREDAEFRKNIIEALAYDIGRLSPGGEDAKQKGEGGGRRSNNRGDPDAQKAAEGRQTGTREWVRRRGEGGPPPNNGPPPPDQNRDQRQQ